jgi:hypothetical protein
MNTQSENIAELAVALAKAQTEIGSVHKDAANPFFKSSYATLANVWEAVRPVLSKNGLSVVQMPGSDERGYYVQTQLMHGSGQWIRSTTYMKPAKEDPQGIGSLISYARRYALQAMVMACPDDDDGEAAMGRTSKPVESSKPVVKAKPAEAPAKPVTEAPNAKDTRFDGKPSLLDLHTGLTAANLTPNEFILAMQHFKQIPITATDFFKMKEETAAKFFGMLKDVITSTREWKALSNNLTTNKQ